MVIVVGKSDVYYGGNSWYLDIIVIENTCWHLRHLWRYLWYNWDLWSHMVFFGAFCCHLRDLLRYLWYIWDLRSHILSFMQWGTVWLEVGDKLILEKYWELVDSNCGTFTLYLSMVTSCLLDFPLKQYYILNYGICMHIISYLHGNIGD